MKEVSPSRLPSRTQGSNFFSSSPAVQSCWFWNPLSSVPQVLKHLCNQHFQGSSPCSVLNLPLLPVKMSHHYNTQNHMSKKHPSTTYSKTKKLMLSILTACVCLLFHTPNLPYLSYLFIISSINNKSPIQGEILDKNITALNNQCRLLRNWATSTDFAFYVLESGSPFWFPCDTRPHFNFLIIEHLLYWISYLDSGLEDIKVKTRIQIDSCQEWMHHPPTIPVNWGIIIFNI